MIPTKRRIAPVGSAPGRCGSPPLPASIALASGIMDGGFEKPYPSNEGFFVGERPGTLAGVLRRSVSAVAATPGQPLSHFVPEVRSAQNTESS